MLSGCVHARVCLPTAVVDPAFQSLQAKLENVAILFPMYGRTGQSEPSFAGLVYAERTASPRTVTLVGFLCVSAMAQNGPKQLKRAPVWKTVHSNT